MMQVISKWIHGNPAQERIVSAMFEFGLNIGSDGFYYCGPIKLNECSLAAGIGLDRRSFRRFAKKVLKNQELKKIFCNIKTSGYSSEKIARKEGNGLIKLWAFAKKAGIIADVTKLLAESGIVILQLIADNPETIRKPKLVIITEKRVSSKFQKKLERLPNVKKVTVW